MRSKCESWNVTCEPSIIKKWFDCNNVNIIAIENIKYLIRFFTSVTVCYSYVVTLTESRKINIATVCVFFYYSIENSLRKMLRKLYAKRKCMWMYAISNIQIAHKQWQLSFEYSRIYLLSHIYANRFTKWKFTWWLYSFFFFFRTRCRSSFRLKIQIITKLSRWKESIQGKFSTNFKQNITLFKMSVCTTTVKLMAFEYGEYSQIGTYC